jgi:hypothetical protein
MRCCKARLLVGAPTLGLLTSVAANGAADIALCSIVEKPANFNQQSVTLQGTALGVKETTSHRGNDYTTFKLQDPSGCGAVNIFTWGHERRSSPRGRCIRVRTSSGPLHEVEGN